MLKHFINTILFTSHAERDLEASFLAVTLCSIYFLYEKNLSKGTLAPEVIKFSLSRPALAHRFYKCILSD